MRSRTVKLTLLFLSTLVLVALLGGTAWALSDTEQLGKNLFFDTNLSRPAGLACAGCHGQSAGYTGPDSSINRRGAVYEGASPGMYGNRKPPSAAYGGNSPVLHYDAVQGWVGGMFWDGRATGWILRDPLAEQAQGPFLNPREQNLPDAKALVTKVQHSGYAWLFEKVYGRHAFANIKVAYANIGRAIAAYERSSTVSSFSSRYDTYLRTGKGLTQQELQGLKLFTTKAQCVSCHSGKDFTDYTYDNLGIPPNPLNPFYNEDTLVVNGNVVNPAGKDWIDLGLGGFLASTAGMTRDYSADAPANEGKFKVPTLRNVDKRPNPGFVKAYGHNGYFKSLEEIVHFYNTRDVDGAGWNDVDWPAPEVATNMNKIEVGNLGLTGRQERAIVAFLKTLTDR